MTANSTEQMRPLAGVRIADFTWAGTGPFGTQLLGFLGAEIIKIETRHRPDSIRRFSRVHGWKDEIVDLDGEPYFNEINTNKLGLGLNLKDPRAVDLARRLIAKSDVVVENFKAGTFARLGLSYPSLREIRPDIIFCSLSGRGSDQGDFPAYAPIFASMGGLAHLSGYADGPAGSMRMPVDMASGAFAAAGILAALWHRDETGQGQYVDLSCQEVSSCLVGDAILRASAGLGNAGRVGNEHPHWSPHDCYPCRGKDEWISIAVRSTQEWQALCTAISQPEIARAPDLQDADGRRHARAKIDAAIREWTSARTKEDAMRELQSRGVAAVPSFNFRDFATDPHLAARQFFKPVPHPVSGSVPVMGAPWRFKRHPPKDSFPAPLFGQHNEYVLNDLLGLSQNEIDHLAREGAIETPTPRPGREALFSLRPGAAPSKAARPAHNPAGSPESALWPLKVLELAASSAAGYCGRILADLGARVTKVVLGKPDDVCSYSYENAGKKAIDAKIGSEAGRAAVLLAIADADLIIVDEASLTGSLGESLSVARLAQSYPEKVLLCISPFGIDGPNSQLKSAPLNSYHAGGQGYLFPPTLDYLDRSPLKTAGNAGEYEAGVCASVAALGALFARRTSGRGELIDVSKQECGLNMNRLFGPRYLADGVVETRGTQAYPWAGVFWCSDGEVTLLCQEEHQWHALARAMGTPALAEDSRFGSPAKRRSNGPELRKLIAEWMRSRTRETVMEALNREGTPAGPVRRPDEILTAPEFLSRGFLQALPMPGAPAAVAPGLPFTLTATPSLIAGPAPSAEATTAATSRQAEVSIPSV